MRKIKSLLFAVLFLFITNSISIKVICASYSNNVKFTRKVEQQSASIVQEAVFYLSEGLRVKGKLFYPAQRNKKWPLIILNHDGVSGISKATARRAVELASHGFVVFAPAYRGEDGSEGEIEVAKGEVTDIISAVEFLRMQHEVDSERIALIGTSHGALISVLAACRSDKIKAVVAAYGVMDIFAWWQYLITKNGAVPKDPLSIKIYGSGPQDKPEAFHIRNAVSYIDRLNAPVLIVQGSKDSVVPPEQAELFRKALLTAGKPHETFLAPHGEHGFLIYLEELGGTEREEAELAWKVIMRFLRKHLK